MRTGYNSNHGHRGVNFHIQTEDSGRARPHVITHLFHGGTILASEKTDYSDRLESPQLEDDINLAYNFICETSDLVFNLSV